MAEEVKKGKALNIECSPEQKEEIKEEIIYQTKLGNQYPEYVLGIRKYSYLTNQYQVIFDCTEQCMPVQEYLETLSGQEKEFQKKLVCGQIYKISCWMVSERQYHGNIKPSSFLYDNDKILLSDFDSRGRKFMKNICEDKRDSLGYSQRQFCNKEFLEIIRKYEKDPYNRDLNIKEQYGKIRSLNKHLQIDLWAIGVVMLEILCPSISSDQSLENCYALNSRLLEQNLHNLQQNKYQLQLDFYKKEQNLYEDFEYIQQSSQKIKSEKLPCIQFNQKQKVHERLKNQIKNVSTESLQNQECNLPQSQIFTLNDTERLLTELDTGKYEEIVSYDAVIQMNLAQLNNFELKLSQWKNNDIIEFKQNETQKNIIYQEMQKQINWRKRALQFMQQQNNTNKNDALIFYLNDEEFKQLQRNNDLFSKIQDQYKNMRIDQLKKANTIKQLKIKCNIDDFSDNFLFSLVSEKSLIHIQECQFNRPLQLEWQGEQQLINTGLPKLVDFNEQIKLISKQNVVIERNFLKLYDLKNQQNQTVEQALLQFFKQFLQPCMQFNKEKIQVDQQIIESLNNQNQAQGNLNLNGVKYIGQQINNMPNGFGFLIFSQTLIKLGIFANGQLLQGWSIELQSYLKFYKYIYFYKGMFKDGQMNGKGKLKIYQTLNKNQKLQFLLVESIKSGKQNSDNFGEFQNGKLQGFGLRIKYNKDGLHQYYEGKFHQGKIEGLGRFKIEGRDWQQGNFIKEKFIPV